MHVKSALIMDTARTIQAEIISGDLSGRSQCKGRGTCRCAIIVRRGLRGRSLLSNCDRNRSREASVTL